LQDVEGMNCGGVCQRASESRGVLEVIEIGWGPEARA